MKQAIAFAALIITAFAFPAHGQETTCVKGKTTISVDDKGRTIIRTPTVCTSTQR